MNEVSEIWKDIPGYEGLYQASTNGNIRSLGVYRQDKNGNLKFYNGKTLQTFLRTYPSIKLWKNKERKQFSVHRLIAITFIENPFGLPEVNHKDCNKLNNHVSNLEWLTASQNCKHAFKSGRMPHVGVTGKDNHSSKLTIDSSTGKTFFSIKEAYDSSDKSVGLVYFNAMLNGTKKNYTSYKIIGT